MTLRRENTIHCFNFPHIQPVNPKQPQANFLLKLRNLIMWPWRNKCPERASQTLTEVTCRAEGAGALPAMGPLCKAKQQSPGHWRVPRKGDHWCRGDPGHAPRRPGDWADRKDDATPHQGRAGEAGRRVATARRETGLALPLALGVSLEAMKTYMAEGEL